MSSAGKRLAWVGAVTAGAGLLSAGLLGTGALDGVQRSLSDRLFPIGAADGRVVVVGVDDDALVAAGTPWPWPRDVHASLLRAIGKAGAGAVGYDLLLAPARPDDAALVDALDEAPPLVLAAVPGGARTDGDRRVPAVDELVEPAPIFLDGGALIAHVGVNRDGRDGVSRDVPLVVETDDGRFVPGLSAALAAVADGAAPEPIIRKGAIQIGERVVRTERHGILRIAWPSRDALLGKGAYVSAADLLEGRVRDGALDGKLVLVGVAAPSLGDIHLTPLDKGKGIPGVAIHAAALNSILTGSSVRDGSSVTATIAAMILAAAGAAATLRRRLRLAAVVVPLLLVAYLAFASARAGAGVFEHLVVPPLALAVATVAAIVIRYLTEARDRRRVAGLLSRYVPPSVAARLVADTPALDVVKGQRAEVTVFFCDLRGFTPFTASLQPEEVRTALDLYYDVVAGEIADHGGTLMQFVGDEVFAVFGVPEPQTDHRRRAVDCALAVQRARQRIAERLAAIGLPPISYGISVHSGQVVAASVGNDSRRQYSVIGDTVNMGSRLCGQAGTGEIVVSDEAAEDRTFDHAERTGPMALKGAARPLEGWRIADPSLTAAPTSA